VPITLHDTADQPCGVILDRIECASVLLEMRRAMGEGGRAVRIRVMAALERAARYAPADLMSEPMSKPSDMSEQPDMIGAVEAATILKVSRRQAQRIIAASGRGFQDETGQWFMHRDDLEEVANARLSG